MTQRFMSGVDVGVRLSPASPVLLCSGYSHPRQSAPNAAKIQVFSHRTVTIAPTTCHAAWDRGFAASARRAQPRVTAGDGAGAPSSGGGRGWGPAREGGEAAPESQSGEAATPA